jgi:hypothetical protein
VNPLEQHGLFHAGKHVEPMATGPVETEPDRRTRTREVTQPHHAKRNVLMRDRAVSDPGTGLADTSDLAVVQKDAMNERGIVSEQPFVVEPIHGSHTVFLEIEDGIHFRL